MSADSADDNRTFEKEFQNINLELGQDDLGQSFYKRLV